MRFCLFCGLLIIDIVCTNSCFAASAGKSGFYVAIKGGVSLGSYESGLNWVLLNYIQKNAEHNTLYSISGASAGSINSLLSAIEYCQPRSIDNPVGNAFSSSWDVGLAGLLRRGTATRALFNRQVLEEKVDAIAQRLNTPASRSCRVIITMSVTRFQPYKVPVTGTGHDITLQRFVVPIEVSANKGARIVFKNIYALKSNSNKFDTVPSVYIHLPEDAQGNISFKRIKDLTFASSAFPIAFSPKLLEHCFSTKVRVGTPCVENKGRIEKNVKFSDGGVFDNSPIGVALDIRNRKLVFSRQGPSDHDSIIFYINPDNYRGRSNSHSSGTERRVGVAATSNSETGIAEYSVYLYNAFANATSFELQKALIALEHPDSSAVKLITSNRYHHLLADFHAHFGAFYSSDFRLHDYIVGLYDGISNLALFTCGSGADSRACRSDYIRRNIESMFSSNRVGDELYKQFIAYLYYDEYGITNSNRYVGNHLIALNRAFLEAFGSSSKQQVKSVNMSAYIEALSKLTNGEFKNAPFSNQTLTIVKHYDKWQSENIQYALANIAAMQSCGDKCADANKVIGELLETSEPIIDSALIHLEKGVWPLSFDLIQNSSTTLGVNLGYDVLEQSGVTGLKTRFFLPRSCCKSASVDLEISHHNLSSERFNDNYYSVSLGAIRHMNGGASIFMPTVGGGVEYSGASTIYRHKDSSAYITAGFLAEIINLKWSYRIDDVGEYQTQNIRSRYGFLISLELGRIAQIIF